jgi:hypothetical protein
LTAHHMQRVFRKLRSDFHKSKLTEFNASLQLCAALWSTMLLDVKPCSLVEFLRYFGGTKRDGCEILWAKNGAVWRCMHLHKAIPVTEGYAVA